MPQRADQPSGRLGSPKALAHDLPFLFDLRHEADMNSVQYKLMAVRRSPGGCGVVDPDGPIRTWKASKRIKVLRQNAEALERRMSGTDFGSPEDEQQSRVIGGDVYEVWEAVVEEHVFGGVVGRLRNELKPRKLRDVLIPDEIYAPVYEGMTRTGYWRHEQARAANAAPPLPSEVLVEIERIASVLDDIDERKRDLDR